MLKATKVRLYPTSEQEVFLNAQFGAVRFAYNQALRIKTHFYKKKGVSLHPIKDIKPLLSVAKRSRKYAWLAQYDSIALQQAVINLNVALFLLARIYCKILLFQSTRCNMTKQDHRGTQQTCATKPNETPFKKYFLHFLTNDAVDFCG